MESTLLQGRVGINMSLKCGVSRKGELFVHCSSGSVCCLPVCFLNMIEGKLEIL